MLCCCFGVWLPVCSAQNYLMLRHLKPYVSPAAEGFWTAGAAMDNITKLPWWIGDGPNPDLVEFRGDADETIKLVNLQRRCHFLNGHQHHASNGVCLSVASGPFVDVAASFLFLKHYKFNSFHLHWIGAVAKKQYICIRFKTKITESVFY